MNKKTRRERAHYCTKVVIKTSEKIIESSTSDNISLNGIFVESKDILPVNTKCKLEITLSASTDGIKLKMDAKVARVTPKGMGLSFEVMDVETFRHIKNLVMYNSEDPNKIIDQCEKYPGFKIEDD
ncbi:MAG: hypothetical protein A2504_11030 [Bdellovibrionales bacterium RIFOXYD12_FULL_39_22]|nr:MAG: hypothetical protein A2385_09595 [Bdellovibrionales bacterium RIFOXYB1_FULL_39_21]OFZ44209.1 MAG: hypothetical protein A2485_07215 [Bdellovibrionales bacterium RIFOXYC12_FULL_39_17]OFZ46751.1 MAG: hypothetical protein A2404_04450 [Bdellovibrionales bacterium RIFOXYC1_FULL_39_130]OFZ72255.1 MAG: hypothetical protein A2451_01085 [Bdellovibrionales bacterium RIFOXYC2_FULL_39_8]OFZ75972.1 MAG: hypothetical protein A2560_02700 [Bdellovibrionales bacterium RIFOXYD1_FULL_39_84]OFZ95431.1 MAG: